MNVTVKMMNDVFSKVAKLALRNVSVDEINWFEYARWAHEHGAPVTFMVLGK